MKSHIIHHGNTDVQANDRNAASVHHRCGLRAPSDSPNPCPIRKPCRFGADNKTPAIVNAVQFEGIKLRTL